uniref:Uncharacterized protein n=1 Tax=Cannabis sativa TaxID=3483 RepID=A0A803R9E7_CANSA
MNLRLWKTTFAAILVRHSDIKGKFQLNCRQFTRKGSPNTTWLTLAAHRNIQIPIIQSKFKDIGWTHRRPQKLNERSMKGV